MVAKAPTTMMAMVLLVLLSSCRQEPENRGANVSATLDKVLPTENFSALDVDYSLDSQSVSSLKIDGHRMLKLLGFDAYITRISRDVERGIDVILIEVSSRAHSRIYVIQKDLKASMLFEVSDIAGAEDRPMTDDEVVKLFNEDNGVFMNVQPVALIVEPRLARDAQARKVILPQGYITAQEYRRKKDL